MRDGPVRHPITREIWGDSDTVLLVFAGAAAEFALNRAVDWLFFTGALPGDPIGRLFRTVRYAQAIAFASPSEADRTLEQIRQVHSAVERNRGMIIPDWSHRAVLYMLIDYSQRAGRLLRGPLDYLQCEQLYADFRRIGEGLGIPDLPLSYQGWATHRALQLRSDLAHSPYTTQLYLAYRRHLGPWRYQLLLRLQAVLTPRLVREQLSLPNLAAGKGLIAIWRGIRRLRLEAAAHRLVIPRQHWGNLKALEQPAAQPLSTPRDSCFRSSAQARQGRVVPR